MINIYTEKEINIMRAGGKILARIMEELKKKVKPGITTKYLDRVAEDLIFKYKAEPSFRGFNNYPAALCVSINEEIVHAVPSNRKIKNGDILSLDLGIRFKGYCTDMAFTIAVLDLIEGSGWIRAREIDKRTKELIDVTRKALDIGIAQCRSENYLKDIGSAIENYVEKNGFKVIRELVGHGVGKKVHEDPQIPNFADVNQNIQLKQGMVLALEPMVTGGDWKIQKTKDGFGYKTTDNSLSAHFEHTIAITKREPVILTKI